MEGAGFAQLRSPYDALLPSIRSTIPHCLVPQQRVTPGWPYRASRTGPAPLGRTRSSVSTILLCPSSRPVRCCTSHGESSCHSLGEGGLVPESISGSQSLLDGSPLWTKGANRGLRVVLRTCVEESVVEQSMKHMVKLLNDSLACRFFSFVFCAVSGNSPPVKMNV